MGRPVQSLTPASSCMLPLNAADVGVLDLRARVPAVNTSLSTSHTHMYHERFVSKRTLNGENILKLLDNVLT